MKTWWAQVVLDHDLDLHRLFLLQAAAEAWDRMTGAREVLAREGITCAGKYGLKQHPAAAIERDAKTQFARLLRDLKLDPPIGEPIAPLGAGQPFHQALKRTSAGHSSLHRITCCSRSMLLRCNLSKVRYESTGRLYLGRQNQQDFRLLRCLRMGHHLTE
jgi:hypothetical protein